MTGFNDKSEPEAFSSPSKEAGGTLDHTINTAERVTPGHWTQKLADKLIPVSTRPFVKELRRLEAEHTGQTQRYAGKAVAVLTETFASSAAGSPAGAIIDAGAGTLKSRNNHCETIERLAEKNVPGYQCKIETIHGVKVRLYVDASDEHNPVTYHNSYEYPNDRQLQKGIESKLNALTAQATEDVQTYKAQHGGDEGYDKMLKEHLGSGRFEQSYRESLAAETIAEQQRTQEIEASRNNTPHGFNNASPYGFNS